MHCVYVLILQCIAKHKTLIKNARKKYTENMYKHNLFNPQVWELVKEIVHYCMQTCVVIIPILYLTNTSLFHEPESITKLLLKL